MADGWRCRMADFVQADIEGGHLVIMEAVVADGHLRVESTWSNVYIEGDLPGERELVGATMTTRTVWLNDMPVTDPERADRLWREALAL